MIGEVCSAAMAVARNAVPQKKIVTVRKRAGIATGRLSPSDA
jgi:hypothetical protein